MNLIAFIILHFLGLQHSETYPPPTRAQGIPYEISQSPETKQMSLKGGFIFKTDGQQT